MSRKHNNRHRGWLVGCLLLLSCSTVKALQTSPTSTKCLRVSHEILQGLQKSAADKSRLDLETDFHDASTGLYSEGVWHNCMAGIASLKGERDIDAASRIADSLFRHSWDGTSFRRRAWSGNWDHSRLLPKDTDVVQANYYKESSEHRCVQHGLALVFWSLLVQDSDSTALQKQQQALIAKHFIDEFWNGQRWTTISQSQGGGTTLRPSASSGAPTISDQESNYFRAVDQAVAVLACLQHLRVLEKDNQDERERYASLIKTTCKDLLEGFGYNHLPGAQTYLGLNRNRNFWHEGWVMLALTCARDFVWPMDVQEGQLRALWEGLMERYQDPQDGTIWHWALTDKAADSNVRYCGDNVMGFAIRRNCNTLGKDSEDVAFWSFIDMHRSKNEGQYQLASVADVYPQVRLHPNTELAALLVWPS